MKTHWIDLNCDVGEGVGNEHLLFPHISSCNIACGGHAGDPSTMAQTIHLAQQEGVKIGAHPSYPDRKNFGRLSLDIPAGKLMDSISSQILSLKTLLDDMNSPMHHIKAHGALYNDLAKGGTLAEYYLETIAPYRDSALVYAPCGSVFARMARALGFKVWEEAFMDRAYEPDGSLVSRKLPGSLLTTAEEVGAQLQEMVLHHRVKCRDGSYFSLEAQTYCLHGDTPNASEILMYLTESLLGELIQIRQ